ncbi:kinase-like protein [Auricularia subglabra TFB-10046 SS5]|nr:kinase-like protein [Auricularia subglabra TFB-10046 SS5]
MLDLDRIAQVAGFIQIACALPSAIRAATAAAPDADEPLAFGQPSHTLARSLKQVRAVLDQGHGVLQPDLTALLQIAWAVPAALNDVNGASPEVDALVADVDAFSRTLLRQKEVLEAQHLQMKPSVMQGVARAYNVAQEILRKFDEHAATFSGLAVAGPFRVTGDDGRRQIDEWRDHLAQRVRSIKAYLDEHEQSIANALPSSGQDDDATLGGGFELPFTFRDQRVRIRIPSRSFFARGASGTVVRALIMAGNTLERVVLKVPHRLSSPAERELLVREVDLWSRLDHARILPYYGTCHLGFNHSESALVSPFMENGNMCQFLKVNPGANRLLLVQQVAEGLHYLHGVARIVHGDLKCENVLVSNDGSAVLSDFGLSTLVDAGNNLTSTTLRVRNTLRFAAPELLLDEAYDGRMSQRPRSKTTFTDVYAYGMLIYQTYTGAPPWPGANDMQVIRFITNGLLPPRVHQEPLLNDRLWEVCRQCWNFDPQERPDTRQILEQLDTA